MNKLRDKILGCEFKVNSEIVEIDGSKYEMKCPNYNTLDTITNKSSISKGGSHLDFMIWSIICTAHDPETGKLVFEETDYDTFKSLPPNGYIEELADAAARVIQTQPINDKKK